MGRAGLSLFLTDPLTCKAKPELAERVFYALRSATMNGLARHVSQDLMNKKKHCPHELLSGLDNYYKTHLRRQGSLLPDDINTLRALLLLAIKDDTYESVSDDILASPSKTIDELLSNLRVKDTSTQIKDGTNNIQGASSLSLRRSSASGGDRKFGRKRFNNVNKSQ